jgi:hypothetical protein
VPSLCRRPITAVILEAYDGDRPERDGERERWSRLGLRRSWTVRRADRGALASHIGPLTGSFGTLFGAERGPADG